ncbi:MAG: D-glycero-beta-D-manno-heptose 1-phosphate adenylyltransferase [Candidatus Omnitrophica bacterium]|nr:D-glycero-beta-D-manno-heptose 1-phosphate adenylyltransferase [Candidatus Omnitrophota bacterium]
MRDCRRRVRSAKIKNLSQLKKICARLKKQGRVVVFTNGCFDILHLGHVKYLEDAGRYGDILVVAVNSDASVSKIKGSARPIVNQYDRIRIIAGLESVDYAVLFNASTPLDLIRLLRPDILIKGADWKKENIVGAGLVKSYGGRVLTVKLLPDRSTTKLIERIAKIHH